MKFLIFALFLVSISIAGNFGYTETSANLHPVSGSSDAVDITYVNDWVLSTPACGLDVYEDGTNLIVMAANPVNDFVQLYVGSSGTPMTTMPLDGANEYCFGVAWNNNPDTDTYYTNDYMSDLLYHTENFGASWTTSANPAGNNARGMDFDGVDYWTTNGSGGGVWRFQPGVGQEIISTPEVTGQPSGLTVFPRGTNLGIAITTYTNLLFFYEWDGATMSFIDGTTCIPECQISMGLAYSNDNSTFFWSYQDNSNTFHLAEFSLEFTALSRSSWGAVKSSF